MELRRLRTLYLGSVDAWREKINELRAEGKDPARCMEERDWCLGRWSVATSEFLEDPGYAIREMERAESAASGWIGAEREIEAGSILRLASGLLD